MLNVDLKCEGFKDNLAAINRAVRKTAYSVTRKVKEELKDEADSAFDLDSPSRSWILQGFKSEVTQHGLGSYRSALWHRSGFMTKHEEGRTLKAIKDHITIPTEGLREEKKTFRGRREWLKNNKAFRINDGMYVRTGKERDEITPVAFLTKETSYKKQTEYKEVATKVINEEAQSYFENELRQIR